MEVLMLGTGLPQGLTIQLPRDVLCQAVKEDEAAGGDDPAAAPPAPDGDDAVGEPEAEAKEESISILSALEEAAKYPVSLGMVEAGEVYVHLDTTTAEITM